MEGSGGHHSLSDTVASVTAAKVAVDQFKRQAGESGTVANVTVAKFAAAAGLSEEDAQYLADAKVLPTTTVLGNKLRIVQSPSLIEELTSGASPLLSSLTEASEKLGFKSETDDAAAHLVAETQTRIVVVHGKSFVPTEALKRCPPIPPAKAIAISHGISEDDVAYLVTRGALPQSDDTDFATAAGLVIRPFTERGKLLLLETVLLLNDLTKDDLCEHFESSGRKVLLVHGESYVLMEDAKESGLEIAENVIVNQLADKAAAEKAAADKLASEAAVAELAKSLKAAAAAEKAAADEKATTGAAAAAAAAAASNEGGGEARERISSDSQYLEHVVNPWTDTLAGLCLRFVRASFDWLGSKRE